MSHRAWAYVLGVILAGVLLSGLALSGLALSTSLWLTFAVLTVLGIVTHLFKAQGPRHEAWHANLVFYFAGVLLLPPSLFILAVIIPHLVEWAKERLVNSPSLKKWYIQPFNIATHVIAGAAARWVYTAVSAATTTLPIPSTTLAVAAAAFTYLDLNHVLIGQALVLARGVSWRESGILNVENLLADTALLWLGAIVAVLWQLNPWLIILSLSPLVLMHRALSVPRLKHEAQTDVKTGLLNARHFARLFTAEVKRATRFNRPLSLIMGDLDLLRNINNTYGHLAGDAVLAGIGQIIRENVREYDIAGRFGGEEFTIALPEAGLIEVRSFAERLREAIEATSFEVPTSPTPIRATMSFGIACLGLDASTPTDLIHESDVAVYQAKLNGRNRVVCASDVPQSIKLESAPVEERIAAPYAAAFAPRPKMVDDDLKPDDEAPVAPAKGQGQNNPATARNSYAEVLFRLFVGGVIAAGAVVTMLSLARGPQLDLTTIGLLSVLALITQLPQVKNLYGESSVSVSVAINFAAALIAGIPGVALVSAAIALAHEFRRRPALYKTAFNWATHVLAGLMPVLAISVLTIPLRVQNLHWLAFPIAVSALAYYAIDTGLIAAVISLSQGTRFITTWRERFQWLAGHYLALCTMGLFLSVAYVALGPLGALVFTLPVVMMIYAQRQYTKQTEVNVQELQRMYQELSLANREVVEASRAIGQLNDELLMTLGKIIDARDPYVFGHTVQVANYATAIAHELNLSAERMEQVRQAAFLHDIGKIGITERILHKPDTLSDDEYEQIKTHASLGAELLETCQGLRHLVPFVRHHHEQWDGSGYPDGLRGEQAPLEARILAVCDAVEAMASDRPYHRAMSPRAIIAELQRCAEVQFDPTVVEAFVRVIEREGDHLIINSARETWQNHVGNGHQMHYVNGWHTFQEEAVPVMRDVRYPFDGLRASAQGVAQSRPVLPKGIPEVCRNTMVASEVVTP